MSLKLRHFVESIKSLLINVHPVESLQLTSSHCADIKQLMGQLRLLDLGINQDLLVNELKRADRFDISYLGVYEEPTKFSLGIFALKANCKMPIHNHENMYGFIRPIFGHGRIDSYSLEAKQTVVIGGMLSAVKLNSDFPTYMNNECFGLEPEHGNIHTISSYEQSPFVFLDLLIPPYDHGNFKCNYFKIIEDKDGKVKLECIEQPEDYFCDRLNHADIRLS